MVWYGVTIVHPPSEGGSLWSRIPYRVPSEASGVDLPSLSQSATEHGMVVLPTRDQTGDLQIFRVAP